MVERELKLADRTVRWRMLHNVLYVKRPVSPDYQRLNICIPEGYFRHECINGYTAETAPVFLLNMVNGYKPSLPWEPGLIPQQQKPNAALLALEKGYIVVCPGVRGRGLYDERGGHLGAAPAAILDLKAAVRFLRSLSGQIAGDMEKIISDGTSAGGGLSALLGASGNADEYDALLNEMGAENTRDDVFASMCYCPVTNLSHIDEAFEWMYQEFPYYIRPKRFGADLESLPLLPFNEEQRQHQNALAARFPAYVNSQHFFAFTGQPLMLNAQGHGSFEEYLLYFLEKSAQGAIDRGNDLSGCTWIDLKDRTAKVKSLSAYAKAIRRVKPPAGYDSLYADSAENELFALRQGEGRHFSDYSFHNRKTAACIAEANVLHRMNPMDFLEIPQTRKAKYWRFRYGTLDRGCSPACVLMLALKAAQTGANVDFALSWGVGHSGNYDTDELFAWIDDICR